MEQQDYNEARKLLSFQINYNKRNIKATWIIALVIVVNFLLEEYFGGSQNSAVLVRMGANVSVKVLEGEIYRLFSSVFLHAGWLHVLFNTYVLFALGGFFNRILGESRYVSTMLFSGLCGSLVSVFLGKSGISVGASGAIWGIFGASLALSIFKTPLLPEPVRLNLRRVTLINLAINLGISFLPMIDMWAHIGGGVGGFLMGLLIVLLSQNQNTYRMSSYFFRGLSVVLILAYVGSIAYGMYHYSPWSNPMKAPFVEVPLPQVPFKAEMPQGLKEQVMPNNSPGSAHYIFGEPGLDALVVELHFLKMDILSDGTDPDWLRHRQEELLKEKTLPPEVKKTVYFKETLDGGLLYYQQSPKNTELIIHNYLITKDKFVVRVGLLLPSSIKQSEADILADKILKSIRPD